jgi:hypothetical protein
MANKNWIHFDNATKTVLINCQICGNDIYWVPTPPIVVTPGIMASGTSTNTRHLVTCPFLRAKNVPCFTDYAIIYNHTTDQLVDVQLSPKNVSNSILVDMAKKWYENTLGVFDKRAEYLITTIAGLMAINFGIIFAFNISDFLIRLVPNVFFSLSMLFFASSYFPKTVDVYPDVPDTGLEAYNTSVKRKSKWQKFGFASFFMGLLSIAITSTISMKASPDPEVNSIILGGNLTLLPP